MKLLPLALPAGVGCPLPWYQNRTTKLIQNCVTHTLRTQEFEPTPLPLLNGTSELGCEIIEQPAGLHTLGIGTRIVGF